MRINILKSKNPSWINSISVNNLFLATSISLGLSLWQSYVRLGEVSPLRFVGATLWTVGLFAYFSSKYFKRNWLNQAIRKFGIYPILWFASFSIWFGDIFVLGANAQDAGGGGFFFNNIQTKIEGILSSNPNAAGAVDIIGFGFGILQLAMIVYIAFSIFQAIKAQQQDEEWVQSAKVPLIVLFAVTAGDFAVGLI